MKEQKYLKVGGNLYAGIIDVLAAGGSISYLVPALKENSLEKILLWGGLAVLNTALGITNLLLSVEPNKREDTKQY